MMSERIRIQWNRPLLYRSVSEWWTSCKVFGELRAILPGCRNIVISLIDPGNRVF
jgi:hypothetical protein